MNRISQLLLSLFLVGGSLKLVAQGTAFNYQGSLSAAGVPANGSYDMRFAVFDAVTNGTRVSIWLTNNAVSVSNGLFTTTLGFGNTIFTGTNYWLDIAVRNIVEPNFTALVPRQPILPVPYAIFANTASNLIGTVSAAQLTGTLPSGQIAGTYSNPVNYTNGTNTFSGTFSGNGAALSSLNASQLTTGTVADALLTPNVALLNRGQTFTGTNLFTGANNFTNRGNNFSGSFFGNGLVGWIVVSNAAVQTEIDHGYLLTSPQFTTVTLPTSPEILDIVRISGAGLGGWQVRQGTNQSIVGNFMSFRNSGWVQATAASGTWRCMASSANGALMYAGLSSVNGIYASTDYGHTWGSTPATGTGWAGLACSADGSKVFGVPSGGNIQYSYNAGVTWSSIASSSKSWTSVACSADGSRILAAAQNDSLYLSTNSGAVWNLTGPGVGNWIAVACSANGLNLAAAVSGGSIYTSTNGGSTWAGNAPAALWTAVKISADGTKLAATIFNNSIYTSTNSGTSWIRSGAPTNYWSCLTASADCTRLVAGVSNSVLYASVNFGASWTALSGTTNQTWSALTGSADGSQLAGAVNKAAGNLFYSSSSAQISSLVGTNGTLSGSQGSAVELQYIGNGQFMPVSSAGALWAN